MSIDPIYSKSKFWFAIGILEKQIGKNKYRPMLTELSFDNSIYTFICSTVTNLRKNILKNLHTLSYKDLREMPIQN